MAVCFFKETIGQNLFLTKTVELEQKKNATKTLQNCTFLNLVLEHCCLQCCCLDSFTIEKKIPETSQKNILHQLTLNTLDRIRRAAFLSSFFDQGILESVLLFV